MQTEGKGALQGIVVCHFSAMIQSGTDGHPMLEAGDQSGRILTRPPRGNHAGQGESPEGPY